MELLSKPCEPDFEGLRKCLLRRGTPERVYCTEFFLDDDVRDAVAEAFHLTDNLDADSPFFLLQREIAIQRRLGYELVWPREIALKFPAGGGAGKSRALSSDPVSAGPIRSWDDFNRYPWPDPDKMDLASLEWLETHLPENMRCFCAAPVGLYKQLTGYESMYYMMYDDPELLQAVIGRLTDIYVRFIHIVSRFSCVAVIWGSDDMGHKTQTFFPPDFVRSSILPMHRACAEAAHASGRLYFLHSCGNLEAIMDDLIDDVMIDAKHSFEDAICPVETMKERYGSRVSLIGGVDVDFLCRAGIEEIRKKVREILSACQEGGGYCLGSGNSIAGYVPLENYLAMLDEARRWNRASA